MVDPPTALRSLGRASLPRRCRSGNSGADIPLMVVVMKVMIDDEHDDDEDVDTDNHKDEHYCISMHHLKHDTWHIRFVAADI